MMRRVYVVGIEKGHWRGGKGRLLQGLWAAVRPLRCLRIVVGATGSGSHTSGRSVDS